MEVDFIKIISDAWGKYGDTRRIKNITDISVKVSTNAVYKIDLDNKSILFAKLSYFGKHESFSNDHRIINVLANNLGRPFDHFLARSLMKGNALYIHRYRDMEVDASIVFYLPVKIKNRPAKRLQDFEIARLGKNIAMFHLSCDQLRYTLPEPEKTVYDDLRELKLETEGGNIFYQEHEKLILEHAHKFYNNSRLLNYDQFHKIPVFIDWNIGNFSVTNKFDLFSRWDYDWFRMDSRMMDFYFLSRVVSDVGDKSVFSYVFSTLQEERFLLFLKSYHEVFPLSENEVLFLKEAYRFFILNYVIRGGRRFFHEMYNTKLQEEALNIHLPNLDIMFKEDIIFEALQL